MSDEQKGTAYVVLRTAMHSTQEPAEGGMVVNAEPIPGTFTVVTTKDGEPARFAAPNDIAAIKMAEQETGQKFDYGAVAVPVRSWRLRQPKDEMVPRRLWS